MLALGSSCSKTDSGAGPGPGPTPTPPPAVSVEDKVKDSALLYARDIYLWFAQIPSSFNPRSYADPNKIMEAIRPYSMEPGFTNPVDRFSFGALQSDWNNVSSGI